MFSVIKSQTSWAVQTLNYCRPAMFWNRDAQNLHRCHFLIMKYSDVPNLKVHPYLVPSFRTIILHTEYDAKDKQGSLSWTNWNICATLSYCTRLSVSLQRTFHPPSLLLLMPVLQQSDVIRWFCLVKLQVGSYMLWCAPVMVNFWARVLCSLAAEDACFRMRITLGVVLIRCIVFHVCVSECSRNGSGVRPYLWVQEKIV